MIIGNMYINGVKVPDKYKGSNIISNLAISKEDDTYWYVDSNKKVHEGEIPKDRVLEFKDKKFKIDPKGNIFSSSGNISIKGSNIIGSNISMSVNIGSNISNMTITNDEKWDDDEIDKTYKGIEQVLINNDGEDIRFHTYEKGLRVYGDIDSHPIVKRNKLMIQDFDGDLYLSQGIDLKINTGGGDLEGILANPGQLNTDGGDVKLTLEYPLRVIINADPDDVKVEQMHDEGNGVYIPLFEKPKGNLLIRTDGGDVKITYKN